MSKCLKNQSHLRSCNPDHSVPCNWDDYNTADDNDSELVGALVGGPNQNDQYIDERKGSLYNRVSIDYNAGFQTTLAGWNRIGSRRLQL